MSRFRNCTGITFCSALSTAILFAARAGADGDTPDALVIQYRPAANRIIEAAANRTAAYDRLEELCDDIGNRLSGSESLNRAVEWAVASFKKDQQEDVHPEPVMVPHWVRGHESAEMIEPRHRSLAMLGLGGSIATPPEGIRGEVVVVVDEADFDAKAAQVKGRIVLFNNPMPPYDPEKGSDYGKTVRFRGKGAKMVSEKGGIACLVRAVTARSLRSPHTGAMHVEEGAKTVPAAAISVEDASQIARLTARGKKVIVELKMEAHDEGMAPSANVVAELRGKSKPDEVVVISGHLDSWDVGQGAHDDGAGCMMAMEALRLLRALDMRPARTIRVVLWTNEENGLAGAKQYAKDHAAELPKHVAAIEADSGGFRPVGFSFEHEDAAKQEAGRARLGRLMPLIEPLGATKPVGKSSGADVGQMKKAGVPLLGLEVEGSRYFDYHHTQADTLDKVDPRDLEQSAAAMAVFSYVIADMPGRLDDPTEKSTTASQ